MGSTTFDFTGETVVVTGGSSGIGREIALRFGRAGAVVVIGDVRQEPTDVDASIATHELIAERGGTARFVETDVADPDALEVLVESARTFGGVDVMVNNAATHISKPFLAVTPEEFDHICAVNLRGVFFGCQAAAADMVDRGEPGTILNMASISANCAQPEQVQYDTTKGGVRMITRGCALELAEAGIRVNALAPGIIATEFARGRAAAEQAVLAGETTKPVPLGRAGHPIDIGGAALFLASEDAAYITGELLHIDGGYQVS